MNQSVLYKPIWTKPRFHNLGMNLFTFMQRPQSRASFQDTSKSELIRLNRVLAHLLEHENGLGVGLLVYEAPDHDVISRRIGSIDSAKNGESIVHGARKKYGSGFEDVFGDGGAVEEAGFDKVGVDLVEIPDGLALLEN
ncbi:hypothetical protein PanWU01x14_066800 [Parasponia andersonii]|uniref:Uncharacterized protein n=1 Tax=Parasponia andersonii TaxID=3476 RepID=A0A2P5DG82_PARAD|nr:hypothetical protein PanWU01x14_066800 [Parasponia andersonii]